MKFGEYELEDKGHPLGGEMYRVFFPNGYGASIVKFGVSVFGGSYGYHQGRYELAVLSGGESEWDLTYSTSITDDVIGHQTPDEIGVLLTQIKNLSLHETVKEEE